MTKDRLEQLISLRAEIKELDRELKKLKAKKVDTVSDKVEASMKEYPYTRCSVTIQGYDISNLNRQRAAIHKKQILLETRMVDAQVLEAELAEFINTICDSETRRIFHARYEMGKTWEQIGKELHCDRTTAEKRVRKYLRENA